MLEASGYLPCLGGCAGRACRAPDAFGLRSISCPHELTLFWCALPACGRPVLTGLRTMPLPPHLFPLLHRKQCKHTDSQRFCHSLWRNCGVAAVPCPGHRRPAAGVVALGRKPPIILKLKAMPAVLWQEHFSLPRPASAPNPLAAWPRPQAPCDSVWPWKP